MIYKKDITPFAKGGSVTKHKGKGATEQRNPPRTRESLTGGSPLGRAMNTYPKAAPAPAAPAPMPMGLPPKIV